MTPYQKMLLEERFFEPVDTGKYIELWRNNKTEFYGTVSYESFDYFISGFDMALNIVKKELNKISILNQYSE